MWVRREKTEEGKRKKKDVVYFFRVILWVYEEFFCFFFKKLLCKKQPQKRSTANITETSWFGSPKQNTMNKGPASWTVHFTKCILVFLKILFLKCFYLCTNTPPPLP